MNVDINTLLRGMAGKMRGEAMPEREQMSLGGRFEHLIDEKRAELEIALPMPGKLLPELTPAVEKELIEQTLDLVRQGEEGAVSQGIAIAILPLPVPVEGNPHWQLQQIVAENAGTEPMSTDVVESAGKHKTVLPEISLKPTVVNSEKFAAATVVAQPAMAAEKQQVTAANLFQNAVPLEAASQPADMQMVQPQTQVQRPVIPADFTPRPNLMTNAPVIEHQVGTPAWQNAVSQQISVFTRNGVHNAELKLHPEELGSLQINIRMRQDQAQIHIVSEHPQVRQALEAAMPQLRAALAESGVQLGQTNVSDDTQQPAQANSNGKQHEPDENAVLAEDENKHEIVTKPSVSIYGINTFV